MKHILVALCLAVFAPIGLHAQNWPEPTDNFVNDFADVIDADTESDLRTKLEGLRENTGIEAVVVTLPSRAPFQPDGGTLEEFGIGLLNAWKVGDAEKNNGIVLLVLLEDREATIELGAGYKASDSARARTILDTIVLPAFKAGEYQRGIVEGTNAILSRIAGYQIDAAKADLPASNSTAGAPQPQSAGSGKKFLWIFGGLFAALIGWGIFGRRVRDRLTPCPECGEKGLHSERRILEPATETTEGHGEEVVTCQKCGYEKREPFKIAKLQAKSRTEPKEFGGGKSDGGGASGKW